MQTAVGGVGAAAAAAAAAALSGEGGGDVADAAAPILNNVRSDRVGAQRVTGQHQVGRAGSVLSSRASANAGD